MERLRLMNHQQLSKGFTLIELLVSAVIISLLGSAAWFSASVLMQANEVTSNNIVAVNLLRKSQEEVRRVAQNNFDHLGLGDCRFTEPNSCGFEHIAQSFPGYTRTLTVTTPRGTTELKHALIEIHWTELERRRTLQSVILLSRPARSLPGNIIGRVTDGTSGAPIAGANIVVVKASPPMTLPATSQANDLPRTDGRTVNFSFVNALNQFQMDAGNWTLSATAAGYKPYIHPAAIEIQSNVEEQVNFTMERAPANAKIKVKLIKGGAPVSYIPNIPIALYKNGSAVAQGSVRDTYTFPEISFNDAAEQCFTIATNNAYQSGFAGDFSCASSRTQEPRGWSSAVVQADGGLRCSQPWNGNSSPGVDRICVRPGDDIEVSIPVVPVATATINGYVRNQNKDPISGAEIIVRWPDNGNYPWPHKTSTIKTDANGFYTAIVPAAQSMFSNVPSNYIRLFASVDVSITRCCNIEGVVKVNSPPSAVGPLVANDIKSAGDLSVSTAPQSEKCGDAQGVIIDGSAGSGLLDTTITLATSINSTASGSYIFQCAKPVSGTFSVPAKNYTLTASKANFYGFTTSGNEYYTRVGAGVVAVQEGLVNSIGTLELWPKGYGTVRVKIVRHGTGTPVVGAVVTLWGSVNYSGVSNANGELVLENVLETWPVHGVLGNPKYNQTVRDYAAGATHTAYEDGYQLGVKLERGDTITITFTLIPKGGM